MISQKLVNNSEINDYLSILKSIGLKDLEKVSLLDRIDRKFVFHINKLGPLLNALSKDYYILEIDNKKLHPYRTLYFDTKDFKLFHMHQNGRKNRYKFRTRQYSLSGHVFNEVKLKTNKGKTIKERIIRSEFKNEIDTKFSKLITSHTHHIPQELSPSIFINFNRITLCDYGQTERLTIDLNLNYQDTLSEKTKDFRDMIILEVKQDRLTTRSNINTILRDLRIFPTGSSKYCLGIFHLKDDIKRNNFKQKNRLIQKILSS